MFDKIAESKTLKFVLFITAFAFVGTGLVALIVYKLAGGSISGAAVVNGREIPIQLFNREVSNLSNQLEKQGVEVAPMRKLIYQQALENLIAQELLYQEAEKEGIVATKEEVKKAILSYEAFQENGKFSKEKYLSVLRSAGMNPEMFEEMLRKDLTTKHMITMLKASFYITEDEIETFVRKQLTKIKGKAYIFPVNVEISDKEIKEYYEKHKDEFSGKKGKKVIVYKINVKSLGAQKAQEITKKLYKSLKENKEVKTEEGVSLFFDGVVYLDKKEQELPENIIDEIKKLNDKKKIVLLKEKNAYYLIKYEGEYAKPLPLEEVKDKIIASLSEEKREKLSKELLKSLKDKLKKEGIDKVVSGMKPKVEDIKEEKLQLLVAKYGLSNEAVKSLFKTKEGSISEPFLSRGGVIVFSVDKKIPPSKKELDENKKSIRPLLEKEKFNTYIQMYIDKLKKESDIRINPRVIR